MVGIRAEVGMNDDVEAYFAALPPERQARLRELHQLICTTVPAVRIDMQYRMPTYHQGEGWLSIANQKNYLSLYTCGAHHLTEFRRQHPAIKTGKGCINFAPKKPFPVAALRAVITHALNHPKPENA